MFAKYLYSALEHKYLNLGTDIALYWNGQTPGQKRRAYGGINDGVNGSLHAAVHATNENIVLRHVFPMVPYWNQNGQSGGRDYFGEGMPYDFIRNKPLFAKWVSEYMKAGAYDEFTNALVEFYKLGEELQRQGKNPHVYVNW